ncbi:unnamed protein product [marine sediment metagenome]|uniref:Uncharacterized protein n=1 Tax=marine sediment metagenome TaxID=412755 RepID=X1NUG5_9ZZZZ
METKDELRSHTRDETQQVNVLAINGMKPMGALRSQVSLGFHPHMATQICYGFH